MLNGSHSASATPGEQVKESVRKRTAMDGVAAVCTRRPLQAALGAGPVATESSDHPWLCGQSSQTQCSGLAVPCAKESAGVGKPMVRDGPYGWLRRTNAAQLLTGRNLRLAIASRTSHHPADQAEAIAMSDTLLPEGKPMRQVPPFVQDARATRYAGASQHLRRRPPQTDAEMARGLPMEKEPGAGPELHRAPGPGAAPAQGSHTTPTHSGQPCGACYRHDRGHRHQAAACMLPCGRKAYPMAAGPYGKAG